MKGEKEEAIRDKEGVERELEEERKLTI